jgi:hypothetical protein
MRLAVLPNRSRRTQNKKNQNKKADTSNEV